LLYSEATVFKHESPSQLIHTMPDIWLPGSSLVREDGVRLEKIGSGPERQDHFKYRDSDVSFELFATCFDVNLEPTDTWRVYLALALKRYSSLQGIEISAAKEQAITNNIREALLAAPRYRDQPIIKEVKFG